MTSMIKIAQANGNSEVYAWCYEFERAIELKEKLETILNQKFILLWQKEQTLSPSATQR